MNRKPNPIVRLLARILRPVIVEVLKPYELLTAEQQRTAKIAAKQAAEAQIDAWNQEADGLGLTGVDKHRYVCRRISARIG